MRRHFYLSVHYTAPHSPWTGHPQAIVDSYDDCPFASCPQEEPHPWANWLTANCLGNRDMLKGYFAAVTAMDLDVGRILEPPAAARHPRAHPGGIHQRQRLQLRPARLLGQGQRHLTAQHVRELHQGAVPGQPSGPHPARTGDRPDVQRRRLHAHPARLRRRRLSPRPYTTGGPVVPSPASWRAQPRWRATAS